MRRILGLIAWDIRQQRARLWPCYVTPVRSTDAESTMSALSARRQKHPGSQQVPVSVIAVNSSPPPPPPSTEKVSTHGPEIFDLGSPDPYSSSSGRHRNVSESWRERPLSVDAWTPINDDSTMRRSASATLSNDTGDCRAQSSMVPSPTSGSTHHLGSSVTFCNAVAAARSGHVNASVDLNLDDKVGVRRSSSLNHPSNVVLRPYGASATSMGGTQQQQQQQPRGKLGLTLPVITCDGVASVPTSPLRYIRGDFTRFGSTQQLHPGTMSLGGGSRAGGSSRTILVTPQGSFLSVNQSPIEFRESTVSISYSNGAGDRYRDNQKLL